jgi:hypothetical protein
VIAYLCARYPLRFVKRPWRIVAEIVMVAAFLTATVLAFRFPAAAA